MTTTVTIVPHQGRTAMAVDGRVIPGMSYFSYIHLGNPVNPRFFQEMVDAGIRIFFCPWLSNRSRFCGGRGCDEYWPEQGAPDFSILDEWMTMLAGMAPDVWFIPRLYLDTPAWWAARHPEELVRFADSDEAAPLAKRGFPYDAQASFASSRWREDVAGVLRQLVSHVETGPHGNRVLGYMLNSGGTEEWINWGAQQGRLPDYSAPALAAFRHWLARTYGDDAGLRRGWGDPRISIGGIGIPSEAVRRRGSPRLIRDPRLDRAAIDYDLFLSDLGAETLLHFCRTVKEATDGRRLTGAFYGYLLWQSGLVNPIVNNGHLALRKLLDSPDIDFLTGITSYDNREPGGPGSFMLPLESLQAAGKLHFSEVDVRTHLISTPRTEKFETDPGGLQGCWPLRNAGESVAVYRREFAHQLVHGSAWWNFDMGGGWYSCPELIEEFTRQSRIAQQALDWDMSSLAQVAGIVSGKSPAFQRFYRMQDVHGREWVDLQCDRSTANLYKAGMPLDWWMTDDLGRPELRRYKVLYFHNATYLSPAERASVEALKSDGRTLVFVGLPGLLTEDRCAIESAEALTGMRLRLSEIRRPALIDLNFNDELALACEAGSPLGKSAVIGPCLEVNDPEARTLGVWSRTGAPAAAVKTFKNWRSIFFAVPPNQAALFRAIARTAGCHIWTESGRVLFANRSLLAVHMTASSTLCPLKFPAPTTLTDLFTGEVVARNALEFVAPDTWWDATLMYRMREAK
jgi:hypothetical protein